MSRFVSKHVRIGKYSVPALILLAIAVGSVAAVAYAVLQFTLSATVVANPKVCFIKWADGTKANTFSQSFNIFPSIKTIDENASYGIWSWDTVATHVASLRISGITNSANVQTVYLKVYNSTATVVTITWNSGDALPTSWTSFTAAINTKYTIWFEVTATSGATVGQTSVITVDMKVENP